MNLYIFCLGRSRREIEKAKGVEAKFYRPNGLEGTSTTSCKRGRGNL